MSCFAMAVDIIVGETVVIVLSASDRMKRGSAQSSFQWQCHRMAFEWKEERRKHKRKHFNTDKHLIH